MRLNKPHGARTQSDAKPGYGYSVDSLEARSEFGIPRSSSTLQGIVQLECIFYV